MTYDSVKISLLQNGLSSWQSLVFAPFIDFCLFLQNFPKEDKTIVLFAKTLPTSRPNFFMLPFSVRKSMKESHSVFPSSSICLLTNYFCLCPLSLGLSVSLSLLFSVSVSNSLILSRIKFQK